MWDDLKAGFAYWLVGVAQRIHPPLIREIVRMTCNAIAEQGDHDAQS